MGAGFCRVPSSASIWRFELEAPGIEPGTKREKPAFGARTRLFPGRGRGAGWLLLIALLGCGKSEPTASDLAERVEILEREQKLTEALRAAERRDEQKAEDRAVAKMVCRSQYTVQRSRCWFEGGATGCEGDFPFECAADEIAAVDTDEGPDAWRLCCSLVVVPGGAR